MTVATLSQVGVAQEADGVSRTLDEARADLSVALAELRAKRGNIDRMWLYHEGEHPQLWMTDRVREVFGAAFADNGLQDNYCELAVEAAVQRLEVIGWVGPGAEQFDAEWTRNALDLDQEELYRAAGVAGEAFVIVWPRPDGGGYEIAVNDARNVHVEYGSSRRNDRKWAAKVWAEQITAKSWRWRANIYYRPDLPGPDGTTHPGELVRLVGKVTQGRRPNEMPATPDAFTFDPVDPGGPHDFPACPVVRFAHMRKRRSRLRKITPIQDKINKLAANKMVTAEFLAFPWRYLLTADRTFTADKAKVWPGSMLVADPGGAGTGELDDDGGTGGAPTKVGQFDAAQLDNYDKSAQAEIEKLFTIAPLPRHMMVNPGTAPSGDAITADEGPFLASVIDLAQMYGAAHTDVAELMGLEVRPVWGDPAFRSLATLATAILALVNAGVPLEIALEKYARWTGQEIEDLRTAVAEAQARRETAGAAALRAADEGGDPAEVLDRAGLLGQGSASDAVERMTMKERVDAAAVLVRAGWEPNSVAAALGLPTTLEHTGAEPITVRDPDTADAEAALTKAQARAVRADV